MISQDHHATAKNKRRTQRSKVTRDSKGVASIFYLKWLSLLLGQTEI